MSQIVLYSGFDQVEAQPIYLHFDDDLKECRLRIVPSSGTGLHVHIERDETRRFGLFRKKVPNEAASVGESRRFVRDPTLVAVLITVAGMSFSWIVMHVAKTILEKPDIELVAKAPAANPVQAVPANPAYRIWENTRVGTSQPDPELKVVTDNLRHAPIVTPAPGSDPNSPSGPTAFGLE